MNNRSGQLRTRDACERSTAEVLKREVLGYTCAGI